LGSVARKLVTKRNLRRLRDPFGLPSAFRSPAQLVRRLLRTLAPVGAGLAGSRFIPYAPSMDAREAVIEEIRTAPEPVVAEVLDFVRFLKSKPAVGQPAPAASRVLPDFRARQKAIFGDRILPDSQEILDELRADRF